QGQRRLFSSVTSPSLPLIPVGIHPHVHLGLAVEELAEELAYLRRSRKALDALEARPRVDAEECPWIVRVEVDGVSEVACLPRGVLRSEEHTSELQSRFDLVCRLLLEKKNC